MRRERAVFHRLDAEVSVGSISKLWARCAICNSGSAFSIAGSRRSPSWWKSFVEKDFPTQFHRYPTLLSLIAALLLFRFAAWAFNA